MHPNVAAGTGLHLRNRPSPGEATRVALRLYALMAGSLGAVAFLWGPVWLGDLHLPGVPFGRAALIRMAGAVVLAAGFCAAGLSKVNDAPGRARGLAWFIGAHVVVLLVLLVQRVTIFGPGLADQALWLLLFGIVGLLAATHPYVEATVVRLPGAGAAAADRRRSVHEQQIREAAGQEERNRLARDLHDSIKQQIFAIQTAAATAQVRFDTDVAGARQALDQIRSCARDAMTEMEVMLDQLRAVPLGNAGLIAALRKQCEALGFQTGARVDFTVGLLPEDDLLIPGTQQAVLRVAQEALANVARHARAGHVTVSVGSVAGRFELLVQDNGTGVAADHPVSGTGLANMAARATELGASLDVASPAALPAAAPEVMASPTQAPRGTVVRFSVPYGSRHYRRLAWLALWAVLLAAPLTSSTGFRSTLVIAAIAGAALMIVAVLNRSPATRS